MAPLRKIYADASIFGGLFEPEFEHGSMLFLEQFNAQQFDLAISEFVIAEIAQAPLRVREVLVGLLPRALILSKSPEAEDLQNQYLVHKVLPRTSSVDAMHVALATVSGCSAIVSWNFKHIVNERRIALFNAVNLLRGYNGIAIWTPHLVIGNGDSN